MDNRESNLGRALLLRLDAGQPLTALSPAWAALCGLLASGAMRPNVYTLDVTILLLLLVEPLMGGLWALALTPSKRPAPPTGSPVGSEQDVALPPANELPVAAMLDDKVHAEPSRVRRLLPFAQAGSAAGRLISGASAVAGGWQRRGWVIVAFLVTLAFALALSAVFGLAMAGVIAAVVVLALRTRLQTGILAWILQAIYDLLLPWLMGMVALEILARQSLAPYGPPLAAALLFTLAYMACLAMVQNHRLPALIVLDAAQLAVLGLLLVQKETLGVWIVGLSLVAQLVFHPWFVKGGDGPGYVRRVAPYIILSMVAAAVALALPATGL